MKKEEPKKQFLLEKLFEKMMEAGKLSPEDKKILRDAINHEIREKNFKVAIIGQSGVGKTTTLNAIFGLNGYVHNIKEETKEVEEKTFPMEDGFKLAVYDMPGLNNDIDKDIEYEKLYQQILPDCDVIVYIINAHSKDFGEDCRILKNIILPICKNSIDPNNGKNKSDNIVLAVNKVDTIGESVDPNNPKLKWDILSNLPTPELQHCIQTRLNDIGDKLISENLVGKDAIPDEKVVFYSAVFNYNLVAFLKAIADTPRGIFWAGTVGPERIGKWKNFVIK